MKTICRSLISATAAASILTGIAATAHAERPEPNSTVEPVTAEATAASCTYFPGQPEPLRILERNQSMGLGLALGLLGGAAAGAGSSAVTLGLDAPVTVPLGMALGAGAGAALGYNAYQVPPGCIPGQ
ncbi:hypothetical protein [Nocardia vaccinii]|uniref:hypothetical protein n=1 Tax=Nocardia vaccinii TaxID=1822 RepID=UPI0008360774|nr:hypothetical protein [Nocardia vaccinii]